MGHSTSEITAEMTTETQRFHELLKGASKCWRNGRESKTEGCRHNEERENWRLKDYEEQPDLSSQ